jgi:hypothetical protein
MRDLTSSEVHQIQIDSMFINVKFQEFCEDGVLGTLVQGILNDALLQCLALDFKPLSEDVHEF